jgi:hypothetical protein
MDKLEMDNIRSLLKIRTKESNSVKLIMGFLSLLFLLSLTGFITNVFTFHSTVTSYNGTVYANWAFFLMLCACIYHTSLYREFNVRHQVFPQTDKSRYIAYILFCYLSYIKILLFSIALYLLQCGSGLLLDFIKGNVEFAYEFSIFFLFTGFIVQLLYGFILISIILLIGVFDRKFKWWFRILFTGLILIIWLTRDSGWFMKGIGFLTKETSLLLFILKAFILLLLMIGSSYMLNSITKFYKPEKNFSQVHVVFAVFLVVICFLFLNIGNTALEQSAHNSITNDIDDAKEEELLRIDVSNVAKGSTLQLNFINTNKVNYGLNYHESFTNFTEDQLQIEFIPVRNIINQIDMTSFTQPKIEAELVNNTLTIRVSSKENIKVYVNYPYSLMQNFDCFEGHRYYKQNFGYSSSTSGSGMVSIYLPKGKQLILEE